MKRLTRLSRLELQRNPALENPLHEMNNDMEYTDKEEIAAFLRCLP